MNKTKINWERVWKSFNRWFDYYAKNNSWENQVKQIEKIIERQLKEEKVKINVWINKDKSGSQEHRIGIFKFLCWFIGTGVYYLEQDYTIQITKSKDLK